MVNNDSEKDQLTAEKVSGQSQPNAFSISEQPSASVAGSSATTEELSHGKNSAVLNFKPSTSQTQKGANWFGKLKMPLLVAGIIIFLTEFTSS